MERQMYRFVNEQKIEAYDGRVLKRFETGKLVKVAANPTDDILIEFGYFPLESAEKPETDEGHIAIKSYELDTSGLNPTIREKWEVQEVEILGEIVCGPGDNATERATGIAEETGGEEVSEETIGVAQAALERSR